MPSVRDRKRKLRTVEKEENNSVSADYSKYSNYKRKQDPNTKILESSKSKLKPMFLGIILLFALVSVTGIFSPTDLSLNEKHNDDIPSIDELNFDFQYTNLHATIYASSTCDCCHLFEQYLEDNGFTTTMITDVNLAEIKMQYQLSSDYQSCHTTVVNEYFIEGHIPLVAIDKLLDEAPNIDGITLPGMPSGSPGMPGPKAGLFKIISMVEGESVGVFGTV